MKCAPNCCASTGFLITISNICLICLFSSSRFLSLSVNPLSTFSFIMKAGEQPEVGLHRGLELADELESVGREDLP